jgi:hypothetical protein
MLRPSTRILTVLLTTLTLAGCSSLAQPRAGMGSTHMSGNLVSGYELSASGALSLYDALMRTRGGFFSARGTSSLVNPPRDAILVFRAGMLMGDVEVLRIIRPSDVRLVRRLSAVETYDKYGRFVSVGGLEVELVNE